MKNLETKLTAGIRQVMTGKPQTPDAPSQPASPAPQPSTSPRATHAVAAGEVQNPKNSLNNPWKNLHPLRIWPD